MIDIVLWMLLTLATASISALVAKKYGPEYLVGLAAAMAVIANVLAGAKIVQFFIWTVDAGTIVYGALFLVTDMLCEFYGKAEAKKAVWVGFLANIMLAVSIQIALHWTPAPDWGGQEAFVAMFGGTWRIILGSLVAYLISQNTDVFLYSWIKKRTKGRHLWLRNNGSTWISQGVDTVVFTTIAFYGVFPIGGMIIGLYFAKIIIAALDTPFLYAVKWYWKK